MEENVTGTDDQVFIPDLKVGDKVVAYGHMFIMTDAFMTFNQPADIFFESMEKFTERMKIVE